MPSGSVARACRRSASGAASPGRAGRIETGGGFLAGTLTDGSTRERPGRADVGGKRNEIQRRIPEGSPRMQKRNVGRPRGGDPVETRRGILNAAEECFAASGFVGATTRRVAARARVNVATLHY